MAESQYPFTYDPDTEIGVKTSLTEARLGRYLRRAGFDFSVAMRWYLWNARLAKSFQFPLQVLEVTLRNSIVDMLRFGGAPQEWAFDMPYLNRLAAADPSIRDSLNKCKKRLLYKKMNERQFAAQVVGGAHIDIPDFGLIRTDDVVASVSFEFWTALLDGAHERDWQLSLKKVFPNAPHPTSRRDIWKSAKRIKDFRNRVAHHEPIFHLSDLTDIHREILDLIGMRCRFTRNWAQHFSTAPEMISQAGAADSGSAVLLIERARPATVVADLAVPIGKVLPNLHKRRNDLVVGSDGADLVLFAPQDVVNWLLTWVDTEVADLNEPLSDILQKIKPNNRIAVVGAETTVAEAGAMIFARNVPSKKKPTAFVITQDGTEKGAVLGVVLKDDIRPSQT